MQRFETAPKTVGETVSLVANFLGDLASGETITGASAACFVYSGVDPSPSTVLTGSTTVSGTKATQRATAGQPGVTYSITIQAVTSLGNVLWRQTFLSVLPNYP